MTTAANPTFSALELILEENRDVLLRLKHNKKTPTQKFIENVASIVLADKQFVVKDAKHEVTSTHEILDVKGNLNTGRAVGLKLAKLNGSNTVFLTAATYDDVEVDAFKTCGIVKVPNDIWNKVLELD